MIKIPGTFENENEEKLYNSFMQLCDIHFKFSDCNTVDFINAIARVFCSITSQSKHRKECIGLLITRILKHNEYIDDFISQSKE